MDNRKRREFTPKKQSRRSYQETLLCFTITTTLVDVGSVAARPDLFVHPDIDPVAVIRYPFSYGFVLSGDMANVANTVRDFVQVEQRTILKTLEKNTSGFKVRATRICYSDYQNSFTNAVFNQSPLYTY